MKNLFLALILALSLGVSHAQIKMMIDTEKSERDKIDGFMSSGYSQIIVTRVDTDEIEWQQDSTKVMSIVIDTDNNTYTEINYSPQYSKTIIKFDNNIASREIFNEKEQLAGKTLYYYDQGNLVKRELYFGDMKAFDEIYEYESGKLAKMKYVMSDGLLVSYSTFTFDKSNNLLGEMKYNASDELEYNYEYTYDKKSRLTEEIIIMGKENVTVTNYSYNSSGKLTEKLSTSKGKQTSNIKYSYEGNNLSEEIYDTPELKTKKTYTYKDGLLSQIKFEDITETNSYIWVYEYIK
jgi:YD repeat-containing protein